MKRKNRKGKRNRTARRKVLDDLRQLQFPTEFRITAPGLPLDPEQMLQATVVTASAPPTQEQPAETAPAEEGAADRVLAELATCLWYLKTKHFKRNWEEADTGDDDPRVRRTLGRLSKGIDALKREGVEVDDPTNKRYPQGGEGMMRPIEFEPTAGLTFDLVTDTVTPIVYRGDRLIQQGEVFVAVPQEDTPDGIEGSGSRDSRPAAGATPTEPEAPTAARSTGKPLGPEREETGATQDETDGGTGPPQAAASEGVPPADGSAVEQSNDGVDGNSSSTPKKK